MSAFLRVWPIQRSVASALRRDCSAFEVIVSYIGPRDQCDLDPVQTVHTSVDFVGRMQRRKFIRTIYFPSGRHGRNIYLSANRTRTETTKCMTCREISMKRLTWCIFVLSFVVLSGCGGGGSDSGAGSVKSASPFAGQYQGVETLFITGPTGVLPAGTFPLSINIDVNGNVVVTDLDGIQFFGVVGDPALGLMPNKFIATGVLVLPPEPGFACTPVNFS